MNKILNNVIDLRKGEYPITILMAAYIYFIMVTYYFLKPARDSLFLVELGSDQLPFVYILTAIIAVPVISLYARAGRSLKMPQIVNATFLIIILNLVIMRWFLSLNQPWVFYIFYVWVSIFGTLVTSQFWLVANAVYDAAQAKRIFVLLSLGAILGALTGGEITGQITQVWNVSTENLLYFCMIFMGVTLLITNLIWKLKNTRMTEFRSTKQQSEEKTTRMHETFKTIKKSRHLVLLVGITAVTVMAASFIDWQFKTVSVDAIPDKAALTSFLGKFYGRLSLVSLILQLVLAYRFLRVLGVGGIILFLPLSLLIGSGLMLFLPGLTAAVLLRGADGAFRNSIDKTGRELLFFPIPIEIKNKTKMFIDVFVDRWFRGIAGGLLILLTVVLNFSVMQISIFVVIMLLAWIVMAVSMRGEYVNTFRKALEKREIDLDDIRIDLSDSSTVKTLLQSLGSDNEKQIIYSLNILAGAKNIKLIEHVRPLLKHSSPEIRKKALIVLQTHGDQSLVGEISTMTDDEDMQVRREAVYYIYLHSDADRKRFINVFLNHPDGMTRSAAVACIAEYGTPDEKRMVKKEILDSLLTYDKENSVINRVEVARALGTLDFPGRKKYLKRLIYDPEPPVAEAAMESLGKIKDKDFIPDLLKLLVDKRYRAGARLALADYGDEILGVLHDYLIDSKVELVIRRNIPRVLSHIRHQKSVDILTKAVTAADPRLKYNIIRSLNRLRVRFPDLKFDVGHIQEILLDEVRHYYEIMKILYYHRKPANGPEADLLERALNEKQDEYLEHIFRLLGLTYPPGDIYSAYLGIKSNKRSAAANAIEFLDNILGKDLKKYLTPIIDDISFEDTVRRGEELFGHKIVSREDALQKLIEGKDNWLRACAVFNVKGHARAKLKELVVEATEDSDGVVRETARLVMEKCIK